MDLQYFGANCIVLSGKDGRIVVDDNLAAIGAKSVAKEGDITLFTSVPHAPAASAKISFDSPGEYEVSNISITGIPARSHLDEEGAFTATMYKIMAGDITFLFTGHIYPSLSEEQLEAIGMIDVMAVPVGGNGYTLDPAGALKVFKAVEPKLIIPTHYDDKALNYEVPQQTLEQAVHDLGMEPREKVQRLKLKPADIGEITQLVILEKS
jgi:L-ascorbate metabolism protein UlaG (beta-lactamase superfamily)